MTGRQSTLCRLGVHRWEYETTTETRRYRDAGLVLVLVTRARCRRRCPRYPVFRAVDEERMRS
jgi:hypothetical protein